MRSVLPIITAGGAAGMFWNAIPRILRIPLLCGVVAVASFELLKDGSEAFNAPAIFGGQGEQGAAQMVDPKKTEAAAAAGKEVSGARRTVAAQWAGLNADAIQKQAVAEAYSETIEEIARKKLSGKKLTTTEALRLEEYKKLRAEAETAEAQSTAARAEAEANRQAAELNARLISSLQRNDGDILKTFYDIFVPKGAGLGK
jgi:hypothetical protein